MSHVIDNATSALHDAYDETTSMLDNTVPLGEFLDEQLARVRENEIIEDAIIDGSDDESSLPPLVVEGKILVLSSFKFLIVISRYKSQVTQRIELCSLATVPENSIDNPQV